MVPPLFMDIEKGLGDDLQTSCNQRNEIKQTIRRRLGIAFKGGKKHLEEWAGDDSKKNLKAKEATLTGLEPATTGSTVRYSNQLSYSAIIYRKQ